MAAGVLAFAAAIRVADAAPTPAKGWAVSEFATGFATSNNVGPIGIAFDTKGKVYISDSTDGFIYRFPRSGVPAGGWKVASSFRLNSTPYTSIPPLSAIAWGLAFGKDGRFYINRPTNTSGETDEINSLDGKILRVVQSGGLPCPSQLSTDPLSGDLMTDSTCGINGPLYRIRNPASTKPTVAAYSSSLATPDGFDFGRDGTIYIASGYNSVYIINGTNKTTAGKTTLLTGVSPGTDGIGIAADGSFLALNNNNGFMQEVTLPALTTSNIFSSGTRGDIAVGPDGCLYADESTDVVKVTRADGTCPFLPTNPTATPTRTPLRATPTHTRAVTRTPRRTPARTPSRTPSHTPTRTHTRTPTRTATRKPTPTPTRKPTATATAAPIIADLKANWSDSNNPNKSNPKGAWEYRQGTTNLPLISNWNGAGTVGFTMIQPAWAPSDTFGNFLPAFFKARSLPTNMDWQVGDVVVHTVDASNGNQGKGIANVLFTDASFSATVAITGSVWDAAHDTSRPQDWALLVNGTQVASGKMNGAVARAAPQTFKVTGVSLAPGKTVELEVFRDSSGAANCNGGPCGYFVGATLSIR